MRVEDIPVQDPPEIKKISLPEPALYRNIHDRLNEARKAVAYVRKDANVDGKYDVVTHDMVTAMSRQALIDLGILVLTSVIESRMVETGQTYQSGAKVWRYEATFKVHFMGPDGDGFEVVVDAHGIDTGDKAPGKALSMAQKYALLKVLMIETGENEESRVEVADKARQMIDHIFQDVVDHLENKDYLTVFLTSKKLGYEQWADVFNAAPDGQKTKFKDACRDAERIGGEIMTAIDDAIREGDAGAAAENLDGTCDQGKRLLAERLGTKKSVNLGQLIAAIKTGENK